MTYSKKYFLLFAFLFLSFASHAQTLTQTIRGTVVDKVSKTTLPGASIVLVNSNPLVGTTTDPDGNFKLNQIPIGTHALHISFVGYKEITIPNIIVNSGKEVVLTISIEEDVTQLDEIVVRRSEERRVGKECA